MALTDADAGANKVSAEIVDAALTVHRALGPGMLEWVYREALRVELARRGLFVAVKVKLDAIYQGVRLEHAFELDMLVEQCVIVELKACEDLHPVHFAQLRSYLRLTRVEVGLLINFHAPRLKDGLHRVVMRPV